MKKTCFTLLAIILCFIITGANAQSTKPQFPLTSGGWIGGDGAYSVALNDTTRIWLFGDSFIGEIKDNKRYNAIMVNNAIGIEHAGSPVKFFLRGGKTPFFTNERKGEWYWPRDGIRLGDKLYVLLTRVYMRDSTNTTGFGFALAGQDLAIIDVNHPDPLQWKIAYKPLAPGTPNLAAALARDDKYIYLFGDDNSMKHNAFLARIAADDIAAMQKLEYYYPKQKQWKPVYDIKKTLLFAASPEFSVRYNAQQKQWIAVYSPGGMSNQIAVRKAASVTGPWSEPQIVAETPEMKWNKRYYAYEAKQAAPLKTDKPDELTITYLVNAFSIWDVVKDIRIYVPQPLVVPVP